MASISPMPSTSAGQMALSLGSMSTKGFKRLLDSQSLVDVTLACDGGQISAHKVVLSACSSYLHKILKTHPVKHPIIILAELNIVDIKILVNYMYTGELLTMQAPSPSLLRTAAVLNINSLKDFLNESSTSNSPSSSSPNQLTNATSSVATTNTITSNNNNNNTITSNSNNNNNNNNNINSTSLKSEHQLRLEALNLNIRNLGEFLGTTGNTFNHRDDDDFDDDDDEDDDDVYNQDAAMDESSELHLDDYPREDDMMVASQFSLTKNGTHLDMPFDEKEIRCHLCDIKLSDVKCLYRHVLTRHLPDRWGYRCEFCDREFSRDDHLMRHYTTKHKGMEFNREKIRETRRHNREMAKNFHDKHAA